jgi:lipoprotein NlpI
MDMESIIARLLGGFVVKIAAALFALYLASEVYAFVSHAFAPVAAALS